MGIPPYGYANGIPFNYSSGWVIEGGNLISPINGSIYVQLTVCFVVNNAGVSVRLTHNGVSIPTCLGSNCNLSNSDAYITASCNAYLNVNVNDRMGFSVTGVGSGSIVLSRNDYYVNETVYSAVANIFY